MIEPTINDAQTIAGDGDGMILAGRYRIVRQLGQGGMGSVWLAEDTQLDNKPFAIKMLPSILVSNKRAYRQLKDEALVAMKLTHPNIVTLRAFEENNGNPFLVMDYIDGETLDDYLCERGTGNGERGSSLSEEETIRVLRPIAAALDYAHGEGVVHRDVKPANVMIRKDGHPFILDFGIAREIQETLTRVTGKLSSGTLLYMSPEQLNGERPKPAQDIYSFAAMAYECLKGEPPFVRGAIEDQIKNKVPEPLVGRDDPIAPQSIAASVMAGLAKKPEDRPKSCAAVMERKIDFNRVERVDRVDGDGGARRPAEPGGSRVPRDRDDAPQSVGRRVPTPPPPVNDSYRVEHVRSRTPPGGDDVSRKERKERKGGGIGKVLGILALLAALGGGGAWYYHQQQEAEDERKSLTQAEIMKALAAGANFNASNQLAADEEQRCISLISRRFYECWTDFNWSENLRPVLLSVRFGDGGKIRDYRIEQSSGDEKVDQSVLAAAKRADYVTGLSSEFLQKYPEVTISMTPKRQCADAAKAKRERAKANAGPKHGDTKMITLPGGAKIEMIYVAPGSFMMGSPSNEDGRYGDETQHHVTLTKGYWLGKYEVTQEQWQCVMGNNPSEFKGDRNPVDNISWNDCQQFIQKVNARLDCGARLPTEAEWEYACRAGTTTAYYWGNALNGDKANCNGNYPYGTTSTGSYLQRTTPVGLYGANPWGFHDMHGNAWEWCDDWYKNYSGFATGPQSLASGSSRVLRGGSWNYYARDCRSANRYGSNPGNRFSSFGFRLCCDKMPNE